ncbi:MAG TPA: hypothetical protein VFA50_16860 [Stellaceae bacterium]|nr:hypothetical protein [Stellaceae bacterium]
MAREARSRAAPEATVGLDDYAIHADRPLAELRSGANMAYLADRGDGAEPAFFALICERAALPRVDIMPRLRRLEAPNLLTPLAWGPVDWPLSGRRHLAILYAKPAGGRCVATLEETTSPLGEEDALRLFLRRVVPGLKALHEAGIVHGAVNPANLFFRDDARRQFVLGECASTRPAVSQPAAFAPIEMAMAAPGARGQGQPADDVFGLGATLVFLLLGRNPAAGLDETPLLRARIDSGSYTALVGDKRLPVGLIELLRGLLADDAKIRWTIAEVEEWLASRHAVTRQGLGLKRAARPFDFAGRSYFTARALAFAFAGNPGAAAAAVRSDFEPWVQRALGDETSIKLLRAALNEPGSESRTESRDASLAARAGIALDLLAPVRYRGLSAMPDGLGGALVDAVTGGGDVQAIAEAVAQRVPQFWLAARSATAPEHAQLYKLFERLRLQLDDRRLGCGVERLLYELNPGLHCLSPLIEADYVMAMSEVLPALEKRAANEFGGRHPLDRHLAAFIAAKLKTIANDWMDDLSSDKPKEKLLGTLRLLVRLQALGGTAAVPALARWLARQAAPFIDEFHHRPTRKRLAAQLERATQSGRLHDMLFAIDDPEEKRRDEAGFAEARRAHAAVAAELKRAAAAAEGPQRAKQIEALAGQLAAGLATALAAAALAGSAVVLG